MGRIAVMEAMELVEGVEEALKAKRELRDYQLEGVEAVKSGKMAVIICGLGSMGKVVIHAKRIERQRAVEELDAYEGYKGEILIMDEVHCVKAYDSMLSPNMTAAELERVTKRENPKRRVHEDADARPRKAWQTCHGPAQRTRKGRA